MTGFKNVGQFFLLLSYLPTLMISLAVGDDKKDGDTKWMGAMAQFCLIHKTDYEDAKLRNVEVNSADLNEKYDEYKRTWTATNKLPSPPASDSYVQCLCDRMKHLNISNKVSPLRDYCVTFEQYDNAVVFEGVLAALDIASAGACWGACLSSGGIGGSTQLTANHWATACNCVSAVDMGVDATHMWMQKEATKSYLADGESQAVATLLGPVMVGAGAVMSGSACLMGIKNR